MNPKPDRDTEDSAREAKPAREETSTDETGNGRKPRFGKGSGFHGKPGRSGPPLRNRNNLRHGLRAGKLPPKCQYVEHRVNDLRRQLEDAVVSVRGEVGIIEAANINTAAKWERHGLLAQHWLRHEVEKLTPTERLKFSEAIAKASAARDQAIKALGLDRDSADDVLEALYSRVPAPDDAGGNLEDK